MNLSDPLWPSDKPKKNALLNDTAPVSSNASLENQSDAIVDAISTSGSHLWNFKSYWYITVPVTIATMILPVIAGNIIRSSWKSFRRYNSYWRWSLPFLGLAIVIVMDVLLPQHIALLIFGVPFGLLALTMLVRVSAVGQGQRLWCAFAILCGYTITLDAFAISGTMNLTSYVPLAFLSLFWLRNDIRSFFRLRINFQRLILLLAAPLLPRLQKTSKYFDSHPMGRDALFCCNYIALVILLYFEVPMVGYIIIFGISLGVVAINRIVRGLATKQNRLTWLLFLGLYGIAVVLDVTSLADYVGFGCVGWLPVAGLVGVRLVPLMRQLVRRFWRQGLLRQ